MDEEDLEAHGARAGMVVKAVLLDFGGVVASEGFRDALRAVGRRNGYEPDRFSEKARDALYRTGYVAGRAGQGDFWRAVRAATPVVESDETLQTEVLSRFILRRPMLQWVERVRRSGTRVAIFSDQTDWLDALERRERFFHLFDDVFCSYRLGLSKREPRSFDVVVGRLGLRPHEALFVDDSRGHVQRARLRGLNALFMDPDRASPHPSVLGALKKCWPGRSRTRFP